MWHTGLGTCQVLANRVVQQHPHSCCPAPDPHTTCTAFVCRCKAGCVGNHGRQQAAAAVRLHTQEARGAASAHKVTLWCFGLVLFCCHNQQNTPPHASGPGTSLGGKSLPCFPQLGPSASSFSQGLLKLLTVLLRCKSKLSHRLQLHLCACLQVVS